MRHRWILLGVVVASTAAGQSAGDFDIRRSTVDNGGNTISGGNFSITATVGQVDAGQASGGDFAVRGGFWAAATPQIIFSDSFE